MTPLPLPASWPVDVGETRSQAHVLAMVTEAMLNETEE